MPLSQAYIRSSPEPEHSGDVEGSDERFPMAVREREFYPLCALSLGVPPMLGNKYSRKTCASLETKVLLFPWKEIWVGSSEWTRVNCATPCMTQQTPEHTEIFHKAHGLTQLLRCEDMSTSTCNRPKDIPSLQHGKMKQIPPCI